jgi:hypothetical protein
MARSAFVRFSFLWLKGQRDISCSKAFNRHWLETARIATLSQRQFFAPAMLR